MVCGLEHASCLHNRYHLSLVSSPPERAFHDMKEAAACIMLAATV